MTSQPITASQRPQPALHRSTGTLRIRLALLLLSLLGFAWRVYGLGFQSLWRDEVDAIRFASRDLPELLRTFVKPGENGPLFFLVLRPWLALAGQSEFALRFPAALAGVLAIPLSYVLARRILGLWGDSSTQERAGLSLSHVPWVAAVLVAVNPYLVWYSQEAKMYAILLVLALLVHLAFLSALRHGQWYRWLLYVALLAALAMTHVLAILVVLVHGAWLLFLWPRYRRRWLPFLLCLLLPSVPYFMLAGWWQVRLFFSPEFQTGHRFVTLPDVSSALLLGLTRGIAAQPPSWIYIPVLFMLLVGVVMGGRTIGGSATALSNPLAGQNEPADSGAQLPAAYRFPQFRLSAMLLTWLLAPPLILYLISLSKPLFTDRYVIWIAPAFTIILAMGLATLRRIWRPLGWAGAAFLVGLGLAAGWQQSHVPVKADVRAAASYVQSHQAPGDLLMFQIPYVRHTYEYYAGPLEEWADGPYTNNGNPSEQVAQEMAQAVGDASTIWLILSEEPLWDQRGLARAWLETHRIPTNRQQFTRVEVVRFEAPALP